MPLSAAEISALSRLLDAALELPPERHAAWLAALPPEHQALRPHLRDVLARRAAGTGPGGGALISTLPRVGDGAADGAPDAAAGERIGPYRLLREIGRGGMGSVWLAERADGIFQRQVALKLPRLSKSPRLAERMARERQIGALLEHPHIARLYDAGIAADGRPFLVMEYVPGSDLLSHARQRGLNTAARLRLMLQVCAAVAHAHRLLVVHRDLKPSNLWVDEDGQVKLLDFGIARLLESDAAAGANAANATTATLSDEGHRTHTPRYAAPEQRQGAALSTATDIYSLGVVLHELLSGDLPDGGLPRRGPAVSTRLGADLQAVLRRALRHLPAERYSSVERLADDLQSVLAQRPVQAEAASLRHRVALFAHRHRAALGAAVLAGVVLGLGAAALLRQQAREQAQAERAAQAREFLFDLLEDFEPTAGRSAAQLTSGQVLQGALERARRGFAGQPVLRGMVLTELGHLFRRLDQPEQALAVQREALALLAASTAADDPALQMSRARLALELENGADPAARAEAQALARQALAACHGEGIACAKVQAYAHDVLLSQANQRGDGAQALQQAHAALQCYQRAFGATHGEVAMAWRMLALIQRNQGELGQADASLARAWTIAEQAAMRTADIQELRLRRAVSHADLGRHAEALRELQSLLDEPAPPAQRALQQRLQAQSLLAQGRLGAAQAAADAAWASAQAAGPARERAWESAFALQARAGALAGLGRFESAQRDITAASQALQQLGLPETAVPRLRAQRMAGEVALRAGLWARADALLQPLPALHARPPPAGPLAPVDLAQALDLLGTTARQRGDSAGAQALHSQAAALFATALPPTHPLRLKNALDLALARWLQGGGGDRSALQAAAAQYLLALPADSAWRQIPDPRTAAPAVWRPLVL